MTDWYTLKQIGALQAQTNNREFRALIGEKVVISPTDDAKRIISLLNDWKEITDRPVLRWRGMCVLARQLGISYEDIYQPFHQYLGLSI